MQNIHRYDCILVGLKPRNANFGQGHHQSFLFSTELFHSSFKGRSFAHFNSTVSAWLFKNSWLTQLSAVDRRIRM